MRPSVNMTFILGLATLHASTLDEINLLMRNKKMLIYGVKSKDRNTTNGVGLFYNTQNLKLKIEGSDTSFKTGASIKYYPFQTPIYLNVGGNYIDQNIQENTSIPNNVSQYSTALAIGYMLNNDLYLEAGENISRLNGYPVTTNNDTKRQTSKDTYLQIGKRFETPIGTVDTNINNSKIYKTLSVKEESYESSLNYYIDDSIKIGYFYRMNQETISNGYSVNLSYFTTEYTENISQNSYDLKVGIKASFTDISNFSTFKPPRRGKKNLLKSHKFDNLILHDNMYPHR